MRYLVTAHVKPGRRDALRRAIDDGSLGAGSVAGDEYLHDMDHAREYRADASSGWRFLRDTDSRKRALLEHSSSSKASRTPNARTTCRDENGAEPWAAATATEQAAETCFANRASRSNLRPRPGLQAPALSGRPEVGLYTSG